MKSNLSLHWIPEHQSNADTDFIELWSPKVGKIVTASDEDIPVLDVVLKNSDIVIVRSHPISENWGNRNLDNPIQIAIKHAHKYVVMIQRAKIKYNLTSEQLNKIVVEGLNEPRVWTNDESPQKTADYYIAFIEELAKENIRVAALNLGVGWPGNWGIQNAPPDWVPYEKLIQVINKHNGYLGLHEYWGPEGPKAGWGWLAGRWKFCPYKVPIIITEVGLDSRAVAEVDYYGWHGLGQNSTMDRAADLYVYEQLGWYDTQTLLDDRIIGVTIFTYDFQGREWATFDIRPETFKSRLPGHLAWVGERWQSDLEELPLPYHKTDVAWYMPPYKSGEPVPPVVPPEDKNLNLIIEARWNVEEGIREVEAELKELVVTKNKLNETRTRLLQVVEKLTQYLG